MTHNRVLLFAICLLSVFYLFNISLNVLPKELEHEDVSANPDVPPKELEHKDVSANPDVPPKELEHEDVSANSNEPPSNIMDVRDEQEREWGCTPDNCTWLVPQIVGEEYVEPRVKCSPRRRSCNCYADWGFKNACPESFPPDSERTLIAVTGWIWDYDRRYIEGDYVCKHSQPRVIDLHKMSSDDNPDFYVDMTNGGGFEGVLKKRNSRKNSKPNAKAVLLNIEPWARSNFDRPGVDITMTTQHWGDFHTTYLIDHPEWFRSKPYPFEKKKGIAIINSNCVQERKLMFEKLMKLIPGIDSYGGCLNTISEQTMPFCANRMHKGSVNMKKECIIYHYKFILAFENSRHPHYITEKLWQPLKTGTVPVYWGAPEAKQLVPHLDAAIWVDDFASLEDLADYLKLLLDNQELYNKHLEWKHKPFSQAFLKEFEGSLTNFACQIADAHALNRSWVGTSYLP